MLNIKEDIISKISNGTLAEHRYDNLELKSTWDQDCGKKISALANKNPEKVNWLCIGINDAGEIIGNNESWAKNTESNISQHLNHYLDPYQTCKSVTCHELNFKWFIIIEFKNPGSVVDWNRKAYKASGTTIAEMTPEERMSLTVQLPGLTDYTAQNFNGGVDNNLVNKFTLAVSKRRPDELSLKSLHNLNPDNALKQIGIKNKNACDILFGNFQYRIVYYDKQNTIIKNEKHKGLYQIIHDDFITHLQEWSKGQLNIHSNPYPDLALREALSNAVAHAAYFENGGDIIIEVFPDKISISNLCIKESTYFANKWFSQAHTTINRTLMETLRLSGYVDELGIGKNRILSESLKYGKKPPVVVIETAARLDRWRLNIYGGTDNKMQVKLLHQLRDKYTDEKKALIANALVLWSGEPVANIAKYIEGESQNIFIDILRDANGPIFYWKERDQIVLRRWVKILLGEGKESKQFTQAEEDDTFEFLRDIQTKYHRGYVTPKDLRELAALGDTKSAQVMSSQLLKKWEKEKKVTRVKKGTYTFSEQKIESSLEEFLKRFNIDLSTTTPSPKL
jgi:predicted HTH transcriptional regulator